jgi:hypothetical protein
MANSTRAAGALWATAGYAAAMASIRTPRPPSLKPLCFMVTASELDDAPGGRNAIR